MNYAVRCCLPLFFCFTIAANAQDDDCDPNTFSGNSWLEKKRSEYGPNCFQFALNRANSSDFQRYMTLSDGNQVATLDAFKRFDCGTAGGCARSLVRSSYRALSTYHDKSYLPVYTKPVIVQNHGSSFIVTTFTTPIDTALLAFDDNKVLEKMRDEHDDFEDMVITLDRHREEGLVYFKVTGTMDLKKHPLEPTAIGERIVFLANTFLYMLVYELSDMEIREVERLKSTEQQYYSRSSLQALLNIAGMAEPTMAAKEGSWSFTRNQKTEWFRMENDGETLKMLMWMNADAKKKEAAAPKVAEWVKDNPFKNGTTTQFEKRGNDYWVVVNAPLKGKEGSEVQEEYHQEFMDEYSTEFYEEVKDIVDDID